MPDVYMVDARSANISENYSDKIRLLLSVPDFEAMIPQGKKVTFIKANYSPFGYTRHIRPVILRSLVESVNQAGGFAAVTDTSGFFPSGKLQGDRWLAAVEALGYSMESLGCERILANGYEGDDGEFISTGGSELGGVEVARAIREAECVIMVSQVAAHPQAGMFGAIVNLGLECMNNSGKARVYQGLKPDWLGGECQSCGICASVCQWQALIYLDKKLSYNEARCSGCGACLPACPNNVRKLADEQIAAFQRRVAESAAAIVKTLDKKIIYLNFLTDIVPQYYRFAWADAPFVQDIGILASTDPVAVDALSVELVKWAQGLPDTAAEDAGAQAKGVEKFKALTGADPALMLNHAESMGLGSKDYQVLISGR